MDYQRHEGESEGSYIYRICANKEAIGTWQDVAEVLNAGLGYDWGESAYRKKYQSFSTMYNDNQSRFTGDSHVDELRLAKRELQEERVKLQTEKTEYNKWLREHARDALMSEKVAAAIGELEPLKPPTIVPYEPRRQQGILVFGDEHYGTEFKIYDLDGGILNEYSPEIFERRMWELLKKTISICEKEGLSSIKVFSMGDVIDGLLRVNQMARLRYGVVDSAVKYGRFIASWLNELTQHVCVEFQMVDGNHSELRMLGQPKGSFPEDNMGKVVREIITAYLGLNPNFVMKQNPTGLIFDQCCGLNILGVHGEVKNIEEALKDFAHTYNKNIDVLLAGHLHHSRSECVGINRDVINVPSIIGVDPYSMSLNKTSNAGATFLVFEEGCGKVCEYNVKLH